MYVLSQHRCLVLSSQHVRGFHTYGIVAKSFKNLQTKQTIGPNFDLVQSLLFLSFFFCTAGLAPYGYGYSPP